MRLTEETRDLALSLTDKYEQRFGGNPEAGSYYRDEFIGIVGEFACSVYLTGSVDAAACQRLEALSTGVLPSGSDLIGWNLDVKTAGKTSRELYVHPRHVDSDRVYVLASVPCDLHASRQELALVERVQLIGWCYGYELREGMPNFHRGWKYRHVPSLRPMEELKNGTSL